MVHHRVVELVETKLHEAQCGFRRARGTADQIFTLRELQRICRRHGVTLFTAFIDFEKAYDGVPRVLLMELLHRYGLPTDCISIIEAMYNNTSGTNSFTISTGVRQGCLLSCLLFNVIMDAMIRDFLNQCESPGVSIQSGTTHISLDITALLYADDSALTTTSANDLQQKITTFAACARRWGMSEKPKCY